jgi:L-alanine-DL-glutamate epimerase-like enolase superfamily enzyme
MRATEPLCVTFEQPCETLDDIAAIAGKHAAPVSVDETLVTLQDAARIARDGLAEVFGIKLNRVGGLTKAARMRDIALAHGIDMFVMATGGSACWPIPRRCTSRPPSPMPLPRGLGLSGHDHRRHRGRARPAQHRTATCTCPKAPGLGVHPDEAALGPPLRSTMHDMTLIKRGCPDQADTALACAADQPRDLLHGRGQDLRHG